MHVKCQLKCHLNVNCRLVVIRASDGAMTLLYDSTDKFCNWDIEDEDDSNGKDKTCTLMWWSRSYNLGPGIPVDEYDSYFQLYVDGKLPRKYQGNFCKIKHMSIKVIQDVPHPSSAVTAERMFEGDYIDFVLRYAEWT